MVKNPKARVRKRGYKKKPKNKNEIDSFSGVIKKKKKPLEYKKPMVEFQFTHEGRRYGNNKGRLKIDIHGGVSCLLLLETGWKNVKGILNYIKIKK